MKWSRCKVMPEGDGSWERRKEIIYGLKLCILEIGYENASIRNIAMKSGILPGSIHYHFRTKEEILLALLQDLVASADKRYQSLISSTTAPKVKMDFFIDSHLSPDVGAEVGDMASLIHIAALAATRTELRVAYQLAVNHRVEVLNEIIIEVMNWLGRSTARSREISTAVLATIEGHYQFFVSAPQLFERRQATFIAKTMAMGLILRQKTVISSPRFLAIDQDEGIFAP
ncbi:MAG TPA: TetR/AcrR family transcriptional regulator [Candidatus Melainabacteria bacterium]|nr:TetR/AcrR family transcriptional regulator [Candidatus Melainabacteria bacterium]